MDDIQQNHLQEPLLSAQGDGSSGEDAITTTNPALAWPTAAAERAKLFVPSTWTSFSDDDEQKTCVIRFDVQRQLFQVVSSSSNNNNNNKDEQTITIWDWIDPQDVIGAELEIIFLEQQQQQHENDNPALIRRRRVGFYNERAPRRGAADDDDNDIIAAGNKNASSACDVFAPLRHDDMERVFACTTTDIPYDSQATAILNIYCYPRQNTRPQNGWLSWCRLKKDVGRYNNPTPPPSPEDPEQQVQFGHRYAHHVRLEVAPAEDFADIRSLVRAIRRISHSVGPYATTTTTTSPSQTHTGLPRYLVIVNPSSGQKNALTVYNQTVKPMLEQACIDFDTCVTDFRHHAKDRIYKAEGNEEKDILEYDGVICLGGDGILCEVLQGIKARHDADLVMQKIKFGIVGCGTSNGLAKSLLFESKEEYGVLESTFMICKGRAHWMDLSHYETAEKEYTSFLTFTWAIIADIDIESEWLRWLGSLRIDVWGVWRTLNLRTYRARFSYLPACKVKDAATTTTSAELPSLTDPVPSDWEVIEDNFVLFWASHVTHAASNVYNSPSSRIQDGVFQVLIVRACSRFTIAKILLSLDSGGHVNHPASEVYECVAYRLEPITCGSFNDLDGEVIDSGPIQANVLPAAIQFFCGAP